MTDKLEIPDPATLSGEDLNYWCADEQIRSRLTCLNNGTWWFWINETLVRWNPIEDAKQCLGLTPRCSIEWDDDAGGYHATMIKDAAWADWIFSKTELEARCRAYLASKRESDRRGE